jgi:hypothetical protein
MPDSYSQFGDERIKHLELILGVVSRLGSNGSLIKGWALTVVGAFFGFAINESNWRLAAVAVVPTLLFWGLDGYFLRCERLFRCLYSFVRMKDVRIDPFFMGATSDWFIDTFAGAGDKPVESWWATVLSSTLLAFYGLTCTSALALTVLLRCGSH